MSIAAHRAVAAQQADSSVPSDPIFRLSVEQYHEMIRAAILTNDDRVELLEGWLVPGPFKNPPHRVTKELAEELLRAVIPAGWYLTSQEPVTTTTSEPEPDLLVVRGAPRDYEECHPSPENIALVVEVSDSNIGRDRGIKRRIYARANIPVYWIIDVTARQVEVNTLPGGSANEPHYLSAKSYSENEMIPVTVDGHEVGRIAVREMLPRMTP